MSLVEGTVTATADLAGNVTLGGSDFALAIATALDPGIAPSQILAYKAALGNPTAFADLITKLYAATATKIASLTAYLNANISGGGSFTAGGDLSGTSTSQSVIAWLGEALDPFTMGLPIDGQIPVFVSGSTAWKARSISGDITMSNAGVTVVAKINGTTVSTAGGSLTTGTVLRATGGATADWGAVDLANASAVTGTLPTSRQASQAMGGDVSGSTAAATVAKANGASVPAAGSLTTGNVLQVSGSSALSYGSVNLAGGANYVSGLLPAANQSPQTMAGDVTGTTAAATVVQVNGASIPAAGALTTGSLPYVSGASALSYATPAAFPNVLPFPNLQFHKAAYFSGLSAANGNITAGLHYWGFGAITINGTASSPESTAGSTASRLAATKGVTYTQASTSTGRCGIYDSTFINAGVAQVGPWRGNAANRGGFLFRCRFSITAIGNTSALRAFIGLVDAIGATSTDWVTDTTIAKIGIAFTATTTAGSAFPAANWKIVQGAHTTPTATDLGSNFALTVNDFIEVILYAAPNDTQVSYVVNNLTTGNSTSGVLNTTLPSTTTFLLPYANVSVNTTTSGANSTKITLLYLENFDG